MSQCVRVWGGGGGGGGSERRWGADVKTSTDIGGHLLASTKLTQRDCYRASHSAWEIL